MSFSRVFLCIIQDLNAMGLWGSLLSVVFLSFFQVSLHNSNFKSLGFA